MVVWALVDNGLGLVFDLLTVDFSWRRHLGRQYPLPFGLSLPWFLCPSIWLVFVGFLVVGSPFDHGLWTAFSGGNPSLLMGFFVCLCTGSFLPPLHLCVVPVVLRSSVLSLPFVRSFGGVAFAMGFVCGLSAPLGTTFFLDEP
ncbi:hypothetical protein SUGI_0072940 [Cryptomeria japonica]|nr:hypothetical protein SUGI_0072940 [Cryptomeria japonica]